MGTQDGAAGFGLDDPCVDDERAALECTYAGTMRWLESLDERNARPRDRTLLRDEPLPEKGVGAPQAVGDLWELAETRASASSGPRSFHFVVGGTTPAALAGDWVAATLDQVASSASGSPLAVDAERIATRWVAELVGLGRAADGSTDRWTGVMTSGATAANIVGLGAARQWWGEQHGVDIAQDGAFGLPPIRVFASGRVHASVEKALAVLGLGRGSIERMSDANDGKLGVQMFKDACESLDGAPAIVVATSGCADAGGFDPLGVMADVCDEHGLWLHVDGAFGLFAGALLDHAEKVAGVERARSVATDAHKWLNVPYDSGIAFLSDRAFAAKTFRQRAAYLPKASPDAPRRLIPANLVLESSRRARSFSLLAALRAWGASGYREHFDRCFRLAERLANTVREEPLLELVARPESVVVPFRCAPEGVRRRDLDALNVEVSRRVETVGRVAVGTTRLGGKVCFRPAIVGWRTRERHVDELVAEVLDALAFVGAM